MGRGGKSGKWRDGGTGSQRRAEGFPVWRRVLPGLDGGSVREARRLGPYRQEDLEMVFMPMDQDAQRHRGPWGCLDVIFGASRTYTCAGVVPKGCPCGARAMAIGGLGAGGDSGVASVLPVLPAGRNSGGLIAEMLILLNATHLET